MDRLQVSFALLLVVSLSLGGITAVDIGDRFGAMDSSSLIKSQVTIELTDVEIRDDSLVVTTRLQNPTRMDLEINGANFRLFNETNERLASGAGARIDDGDSVLRGKESLTLTYEIGLSNSQRDLSEYALANEASLSMNFAVELGDTGFSIHETSSASEVA